MTELSRLISILLPGISTKLEQFQVDPSIFASQWFLTIFVYNMPFSLVARVWDLFFVKGWSIVFRVSIVLLELVKVEFEQTDDVESILNIVKSIIAKATNPDKIIIRALRLNIDESDFRVLGHGETDVEIYSD